MLILVTCAVGVALLVIEILIQEFNDGFHGNFASWMAGWYLAIGFFPSDEPRLLLTALCLLPSITILIIKLVRRVSDAGRV